LREGREERRDDWGGKRNNEEGKGQWEVREGEERGAEGENGRGG